MFIETVAIVGLGALGAMYADHFSRALPPHSVRVVADAERVDRYRTCGVFVNGHGCKFDDVEPSESGSPADLVVFATKHTDLESAMDAAANQVGPDTTIISVLNGIVSEQQLAMRFGAEKVVMCVAQEMDSVHKGNRTDYRSFGRLAIGVADDVPRLAERLQALREFFEDTETPFLEPPDIRRQMWSKLLCNVGINQACVVYDCNYGGLQAPGEARDAMLGAMRETMVVAQSEGIYLTEKDVDFWSSTVLPTLNPTGFPSMKQDVDSHRPTEVELFGGTICRLGKAHNIPTPVNDAFVAKIKEIEASF